MYKVELLDKFANVNVCEVFQEQRVISGMRVNNYLIQLDIRDGAIWFPILQF